MQAGEQPATCCEFGHAADSLIIGLGPDGPTAAVEAGYWALRAKCQELHRNEEYPSLTASGTLEGGRGGESRDPLPSNLKLSLTVQEWDADAKKWRSFWSTSTYASRSFAVLRALLESVSKLALHLNKKGRL